MFALQNERLGSCAFQLRANSKGSRSLVSGWLFSKRISQLVLLSFTDYTNFVLLVGWSVSYKLWDRTMVGIGQDLTLQWGRKHSIREKKPILKCHFQKWSERLDKIEPWTKLFSFYWEQGSLPLRCRTSPTWFLSQQENINIHVQPITWYQFCKKIHLRC